MRTFVALEIPVQQCFGEILVKLKSELKLEKIKWVDFTSLHLTLFFLGSTTQGNIRLIEDIFKNQVSKSKKFRIELNGFGTFGLSVNPKVLWVGVKNSNELVELHKHVNDSVSEIGFTPDERGFNPHITIGRVKQIRSIDLLNSLLSEHAQSNFQETVIDKVILYRSDLTLSGAVYTPILSQELMG